MYHFKNTFGAKSTTAVVGLQPRKVKTKILEFVHSFTEQSGIRSLFLPINSC